MSGVIFWVGIVVLGRVWRLRAGVGEIGLLRLVANAEKGIIREWRSYGGSAGWRVVEEGSGVLHILVSGSIGCTIWLIYV